MQGLLRPRDDACPDPSIIPPRSGRQGESKGAFHLFPP